MKIVGGRTSARPVSALADWFFILSIRLTLKTSVPVNQSFKKRWVEPCFRKGLRAVRGGDGV